MAAYDATTPVAGRGVPARQELTDKQTDTLIRALSKDHTPADRLAQIGAQARWQSPTSISPSAATRHPNPRGAFCHGRTRSAGEKQ